MSRSGATERAWCAKVDLRLSRSFCRDQYAVILSHGGTWPKSYNPHLSGSRDSA